MADSAVGYTEGSGKNIDTRTEATNGDHRQVVVIGDPSTTAGVAPVDATNGVSVNVSAASGVGSLTEGAPASDTASSGLNGRLQRIAQRLTTLLAVFPATIDTNSGSKSASTLRMVLATDQPQLTNSLLTAPIAQELVLGKTVGILITPSANFTRPSDTTAYASGDLVANSTTAGSVAALSWTAARVSAGNYFARRCRLKKSTTSTTNASFRLHLYNTDPAASSGITNGDNGAWLTKIAGYLGHMDITIDKAFSDAAAGQGVPAIGGEMSAVPAAQTLYGLLEARAAYTPGNAEVFTVELEIFQN